MRRSDDVRSAAAADEQPRRVLFSLLHPGYLRGYADAIRLLAGRGYTIHLALGMPEKDAGGLRIAETLAAECAGVTFAAAPSRPRRAAWSALAWLVRAFTDLARYMHPRYANATGLRERVATKIMKHANDARQVGPITAFACSVVVRVLTRSSGEQPLRRALRVLGALERAIPTSPPVDRLVAEFQPDAVLVAPLVEVASPQLEFLKSAKRAGVRTGVCVSSWDNLTNKGLIRSVPDRVFVWNDVQRREAVELHAIPYDRIVLTGAQRFDEWFERQPTLSAPEFLVKIGLDPERPYLLYVCSSPFIAPDEVSFVTRWLRRIRTAGDDRLAGIGVLVRPHPVNAAQWHGVDLGRFGNAVLWPAGGVQPDIGEARSDYFHSLAHSAAVVGVNTSALIESAIVGKSVYSVLADDFRGTQKGTLHFHYLLHENGGFLHVAETLDEHVAQLERVLTHGAEDADQTRRFVASFVRPNGLDRPATPILADAIAELARLGPPPPERLPIWVWPIRGALGFVVLVSGAIFALDRLARRTARRLRRAPAAPAQPARAGRPDLPPQRP